MRHPESVKGKVRKLRLEGFSLGQIQNETKLAKSTIRLWIGDIILSKEQQSNLKNRTQIALQAGRIRVQVSQKKKRIALEARLLSQGKIEVGSINSRELLIAGIALYWAEGFKNRHEHRLGFCNSDPGMIKFYLYWLEKALGVKKEHIIARLTLNASYQKEVKAIEQYWSEVTGISLNQFTKPFYQRTQWKKQYTEGSYYGVLRIHVQDSLDGLLKMKGWIEGLKTSLPG